MKRIDILSGSKNPFSIRDTSHKRGSRVEVWLHDRMTGFLEFDWKSQKMTLDVVDEDAVVRVMGDVDETR